MIGCAHAAAAENSVRRVFAAGEKGIWLDMYKSAMYQDAGTSTPVTAVEQYVRRIYCATGSGVYAQASSDAKRPVLSARYNMLTKTEAFEHSDWLKTYGGTGTTPVVTDNYGIAPDGANTAARLQASVNYNSTVDVSALTRGTVIASGPSRSGSIWLKSNTGSSQSVWLRTGSASGIKVTATTEWTKFSDTGTNDYFVVGLRGSITSPQNTLDILVWHPDQRVDGDGAGLPAYQRVNTATDYDTVGFPKYLKFSGGQCLATSSIDFSGTDKMTVWAGVRKENTSDSTGRMLVELSPNSVSNNGSFSVTAPEQSNRPYNATSHGSASLTQGAYTALGAPPDTAVLIAIYSIPGDLSRIYRNLVKGNDGTADQGTGNFINNILYIGARGDSSIYFVGRLYSLIVRGAASSIPTLNRINQFVNGRTRAY